MNRLCRPGFSLLVKLHYLGYRAKIAKYCKILQTKKMKLFVESRNVSSNITTVT